MRRRITGILILILALGSIALARHAVPSSSKTASSRFRIIFTGIEAFVPENFDPASNTVTFPLRVVLPNGTNPHPATTCCLTNDSDKVIPAHHAFLQFKMSDWDPTSGNRQPDFRATLPDSNSGTGTEYGFCLVDYEFLTLPAVSAGRTPSGPDFPSTLIDFEKVCERIDSTGKSLRWQIAPAVLKDDKDLAGFPLGLAVSRLNLFALIEPIKDPHSGSVHQGTTPVTWTFHPYKEADASLKTTVYEGKFASFFASSWVIPTDPVITSKSLDTKMKATPAALRLRNRGADVEVWYGNLPLDAMLWQVHGNQDVDTHFELYYKLLTPAHDLPYHVPHRVTTLGGEVGDCGPAGFRNK